ncbi:MAG: hypothetical protein Kow0020_07780 [Wenzhouxiangellaceae bacterium]
MKNVTNYLSASSKNGVVLFVHIVLINIVLFSIPELSPRRLEIVASVNIQSEQEIEQWHRVIADFAESGRVDARDCLERLQIGATTLECTLQFRYTLGHIDRFLAFSEQLAHNGLEFGAYEFRSSPEIRPTSWLVGGLTGAFLLPSLLIVFRSTEPGQHLKRALHVVRSKLWIVFLPLLVTVPVSCFAYFVYSSIADIAGLINTEEIKTNAPYLGEQMVLGPLDPSGLLLFIYFAVLAPAFEEALYRGWAYAWVSKSIPFTTRAITNAATFAVGHVVGMVPFAIVTILATDGATLVIALWLAYFAHKFVLGLFFFWMRERYDSLFVPMLAHMVHNGLYLVGLSVIAKP